MDDVIISIIVPIYNGEKYIDRVVNSILPQLNKKLELILVDDGSTDSSGSICDTYAEKDDNIRTVHKTNGGLSSARNAGITAAKGEYLSFVDVDDYMSGDAYAKLIEVIEAYHPDCIDFGWNYINSCGEQIPNLHGLDKNQLLDRTVIEQLILPPLLNLYKDDAHFIYDFSWNKLFRADIIRQHRISFDEGRRVWEDRPFIVYYLKYCSNYYSIDGCYYNYVDTSGSLSQKYSQDFFDIILANYNFYVRLYGDQYNFDTEYTNSYWCKAIENMIFRSFAQLDNPKEIEAVILRTLQNEQVIFWFTRRIPKSSLDVKVRKYIITGCPQKALNCYTNYYHKKKSKELCLEFLHRIKNKIKQKG